MEEQLTPPNPFAEWLDEQAKLKGLKSRNQLAKYASLTSSQVSNYLTGKTLPDARTRQKLARYFNVDVATVSRLVHDSEAGRLKEESESIEQGADLLLHYVSDLTEEERQSVLDYVAFVRSQRGKRRGAGSREGAGGP